MAGIYIPRAKSTINSGANNPSANKPFTLRADVVSQPKSHEPENDRLNTTSKHGFSQAEAFRARSAKKTTYEEAKRQAQNDDTGMRTSFARNAENSDGTFRPVFRRTMNRDECEHLRILFAREYECSVDDIEYGLLPDGFVIFILHCENGDKRPIFRIYSGIDPRTAQQALPQR